MTTLSKTINCALSVALSLAMTGTLASAQDTPSTTVTAIHEYDVKAFHFSVANPINPAGCANGADMFRVDPDSGAYDNIVSMVMAAYLSGRNVFVEIYDDQCIGGWPRVRRISLN